MNDRRHEAVELFGWIGEDEHGTGEVGLKQGVVPAGRIPLVAVKREKVEKLRLQMEAQARIFGKKIRLVRFVFAEVICETERGK